MTLKHCVVSLIPSMSCRRFRLTSLTMTWTMTCVLTLVFMASPPLIRDSAADYDSEPVPRLAFDWLSGTQWDVAAVQRVLQVFAWGGHATGAQIRAWADMPPQVAIAEMLTFDQHNLKLSPPSPRDRERLDFKPNNLTLLSEFWTSSRPDNTVPPQSRPRLAIRNNLDRVWMTAALARGLNPFLHRIGWYETNYHMATNLSAGVNPYQMARYYDSITYQLSAGNPYHVVLGTAAKSAAIATQYKHRRNRFVRGECRCNEDFAREFYQLLFGILGAYWPQYHETITIKNMAKALTDMKVLKDNATGTLSDTVLFGTAQHYQGPLEMLNQTSNEGRADARIDRMASLSMWHRETFENLPVMIIAGLADDNLTGEKIDVIRRAWRLQPPNRVKLLKFLRSYAISTTFHNPSRIKYFTSVDRHMIIANRFLHTNQEVYLDLYPVKYQLAAEDVRVFRPVHNVFGGQTGEEAAGSAGTYLANNNIWVFNHKRYVKANGNTRGVVWEKDWSAMVPTNANGTYLVADTARWLWNYVVADDFKRFGPLERAHMYALLGGDVDLMQALDANDLDRVILPSEVDSDPKVKALLTELGGREIALTSTDQKTRRKANVRMNRAFAFIAATPYLFAQEGN